MRISRTLVVLVAVLVLSVVRTTTAGYTGTVLYKLTTPSDYPALFNQFDAFGGQFVATATGGGAVHALVWQQNGNVVDLNPSGLANSSAKGTSGTQQVGDGSPTAANYHALLWTGTAASAIDLNPTNYSSSNALGTNGTQQVGYGAGTPTGGSTHALLWTGTADSAIDLNPSGFTYSEATAADGSHQVGYGYIGSFAPPWHALLWSGTSDTRCRSQSERLLRLICLWYWWQRTSWIRGRKPRFQRTRSALVWHGRQRSRSKPSRI